MYPASLISSAPRRFAFFGLAFLVIGSAGLLAQGSQPASADGYDPNVDGNVHALAAQADGKLLIGGSFSSFRPNGTPAGSEIGRSNLARLEANGTPDSFAPNPNGAVNAIVVQPADGKIIIGGSFTSVGGTARNRLARLDSNGALDPDFNPDLGNQLSDVQVYAIALQADGKILVGGTFTSTQGGVATGLARNRLLRLEKNGALDPTFNPDPNNAVFALAVQPSGQILVGGSFTALGSVTRNRIARLLPNGTPDTSFDPNANGTVNSLLVMPDGKIVLGGSFTNLQPSGLASASPHNSLARLNANGSLDNTFVGGANGSVSALALQPDGKLVVGGTFTTLWPASGASSTAGRTYLGRFNADGSLDDTFNPAPNQQVRAIVPLADGSVIFGGLFTQLRSATALFSTSRNRLARVHADGTVDATLDLGTGGGVVTIAVDANGLTLIGGTFNSVGGATRTYLARLNQNGTLDASFNPVLDGRVMAIAVETDGKILIGGAFTTVGSVARPFLARLNANGTLDGNFNPKPNSVVNAIALQSDRKLLIGGAFTSLQPNQSTSATIRSNLARLNADGTVDTAYTPITNGPVLAIKIQGDGKAVIAGAFDAIQPRSGAAASRRVGLARLNADGSIDSFNPNPNNQVNALAFQGDKIIAGGFFDSVQTNGATAARTTRNRIARFNADGSVDTTFNPDANGVVNQVALLPNGKILVAGAFTSLGTTAVREVAMLNTNGSVDTAFKPSPNGRVFAIVPVSDSSILLGGTFSAVQPGGTGPAEPVSRITRVGSTGAVDTAFTPNVGGQPSTAQVNTLALQADGKLLVGGAFTDLGGTTGGGLARFLAEGTPDLAFTPRANGSVNAIVVRPEVSAVTTQGTGFAWITADGTFRPGFTTDANSQFSGRVNTMARQPDGKIILGGTFTNASTATGPNLARFHPNGALDGTLNPGPNGAVTSVIALADGSVLVAGAFTNIAGVARNRIARFGADGQLDANFNPNVAGNIDAMLVQEDGKILIAGAFTSLQPNGAANATTRNYIARLETSGALDTSFDPNPNAQVTSLAIQPHDKKIILGGFFSALQPAGATSSSGRLNLARVKPDGSLDTAFDPNHGSASGPVYAIAVQADQSIIVGGSFSAVGGIPRNNLARMIADGNLDFSFDPAPNGQINAITLTAGGRILVGGFFTKIGGLVRNRVARLEASGTLDTTFDANANNAVVAISLLSDGSIFLGGSFTTLQPGGAIVVGGSFTDIGGAAVNNLAFINDDGTATALRPNPNGAINAVLAQPDGKLVVGGAFTSIGGVARNRLARLNADGTVETAFNPNLDGAVVALAQQVDGKILLAGQFLTVGGVARNNLARLNADGTLDIAFAPSFFVLPVTAIAVQADGKILAGTSLGPGGASFSRFNPDGSTDAMFNLVANGAVNTVTIQADGKILVGGAFTTIRGAARNRVARLNTDGSVDATFNPNADGAVNAIAVQADGKPVIAGAFNSVNGLPRVRVARLAATAPATQSIPSNSPTLLTWNRGGSGPEVSSVTFESSSDGRVWKNLGNAVRIANSSDWWLTTSALPSNTLLYVRARGTAPTTNGGSSSIVQAASQVYYQAQAVVTSAPKASGSADRAFLYAVGATHAPTAYSATGLPPGLSIDATTGIISGTATKHGVFNVTLGVTNAGGTSTHQLTLTIDPATAAAKGSSAGHLLDISCLAHVDTATPLITGFVITGSESKSVLLRAVGPGLTGLGVPGVLASPRLQLHASDGQQLLDNSSWGGESRLAAIFVQAGEFPLEPTSSDAAAAVTLAPGAYTMVVTDNASSGSGGRVLAEIYDVAGSAHQFSAMSARGRVLSGAPLTGGFVVTGDTPRRFLVRGVGPALGGHGVSDALADPVVGVYDMQGRQLALNDNWETPLAGAANSSELTAAALSVGNYAFASGSKDAALIVTLAPGTYTAQVAGVGAATGSAVVEIYELP